MTGHLRNTAVSCSSKMATGWWWSARCLTKGFAMPLTVTGRERSAILSSLGAGVVPRIGLHHIQVGRKPEIAAMMLDLQKVESGASAIRFIVGRFGSGKSFF